MSDQTLMPEPEGYVDSPEGAQETAGTPDAAVAPQTDVPVDPNAELLEALRAAPGEWYVVHSYAGYERRVKQNIEVARKNQDLEEEVFQIEVPMETVWEIKKGERKRVERVKLPGYVLVRMEHSPASWTAIRNTPGVTGFVGHGSEPIPLSVEDVYEMMKAPDRPADKRPEEEAVGGKRVAASTEASQYQVEQVVTIIDGPFEPMQATISEVNPEAQRITAMVELFGRDTPVELRFDQITAI